MPSASKPDCFLDTQMCHCCMMVHDWSSAKTFLQTPGLCCLQPLEAVSPLLLNPHFNAKKPVTIEVLNKVSKELGVIAYWLPVLVTRISSCMWCNLQLCLGSSSLGPACVPCDFWYSTLNLQICAAPVLQLKGVLMAIYFGADHIVWASQAGLYTDKQGTER